MRGEELPCNMKEHALLVECVGEVRGFVYKGLRSNYSKKHQDEAYGLRLEPHLAGATSPMFTAIMEDRVLRVITARTRVILRNLKVFLAAEVDATERKRNATQVVNELYSEAY